MGLIVLIGPQAVGKMTVGQSLENKIDGKLLYNHQTIDLFANFLGYTDTTFQLSNLTRLLLFENFVQNLSSNTVEHLIFTVMIDFNNQDDRNFLQEISEIFTSKAQPVYFIELQADLSTRLKRNQHPNRLAKKPSKRNLVASEKDLLFSNSAYRLNSNKDELTSLFPEISVMVLDNSSLSSDLVTDRIIDYFNL